MTTTTSKFPMIQARHIKTAIVTSIPTCSGVRPRGSTSASGVSLKFLACRFDSVLVFILIAEEKIEIGGLV